MLDGQRFGRRDAPYDALREWQGAQVEGSPERNESPNGLRPRNRKRPRETSHRSRAICTLNECWRNGRGPSRTRCQQAFVRDAERMARFQREAKVLAPSSKSAINPGLRGTKASAKYRLILAAKRSQTV